MDGSAYGRMFSGLYGAALVLIALAPFGVWKLVEIVIWLVRHLRITVA